MDCFLGKNISHHLFVSWKNTLWNQARNPAEKGSKRWHHLRCLKTSARLDWRQQADLASLKISGYLHLRKFPYEDITREKTTLQIFLPMLSPHCSFKRYHRCLDFCHHGWMNLNKPHLTSRILEEDLNCTYFLNTNFFSHSAF